MFVISETREKVLAVLSIPLFVAMVYNVIGMFLWLMVYTAPMMPLPGSQSKSLTAPSWAVTATTTVWSPLILATVVAGALVYLIVYRKVSTSYSKRVELLKRINKTLGKLDTLSVEQGSIRYTLQEKFGPSTAQITYLGNRRYMVRSTRVNVFGTTISGLSTFEVGERHFASSYGASVDMMTLAIGDLLMAKEYGVSNVKAKRIPLGKRLLVRNSSKGYPVGKSHT